MGSAFTPVQPGRPSPMPYSGLKPGGGASRPKRTRQVSSLAHMQMVQEETNEERTAETYPDHVSTSASEASSRCSNNSQPALLDFMGATCMASAWFTSCFPCAVVDINDSDDYVIDKLSRESAMNVMYAKDNINTSGITSSSYSITPENSPVRKQSQGSNSFTGAEEQDSNLMYIRLPEQEQEHHDVVMPLQSMPSVIMEESDEEVEGNDAMDEISLHDDSGSMPVPVAVTLERMDSGIVDNRRPPAVDERPIYSPPKKKKFGMKKLFSRKK